MPNKPLSFEKLTKMAMGRGVTVIVGDPNSDTAKMDSFFSYEPKNKVFTVFTTVILESSPEVKEWFFSLLREIHESKEILWRRTRADLIESYEAYASDSSVDQDLLNYFEDILSRDDYDALKMSLFLRAELKAGHEVYGLKDDIRNRFGERGSNIANLCTAEYFEEFQDMLKSETKEAFMEYYELTVTKRARALFIHKGMTQAEIKKQVLAMVSKARRYGMSEFHLHGRGKENLRRMEKLANQVDSGEEYTIRLVHNKPNLGIVEYEVKLKKQLPRG